jgi:SAM-dependent methyltransferase
LRFSDHFSGHAGDYARYRPTYPSSLFSVLSSLVAARRRCWDAGTGNGQAAIGLAEHFEEVVATDASAEQIAHATPHPRVTYRVAPAERSGLPDRWADLVTVGQAAHWFELKSFYEEVRRVGAGGSVLAVWAYDLFDVPGAPRVDEAFRAFHASVEAYWPPERALVSRRYADLLFPFEEIALTPVPMTAEWSLERVLGYLSTWSAVKRCTKETGRDPVGEFRGRLAAAWGEAAQERTISWPLVLRAGRIR